MTPLADRVGAAGAAFEFEAELPSAEAAADPAAVVPPPVPEGPALAAGRRPAPAFPSRVPKRLLWLVAVIALVAPIVWFAARDSGPSPAAARETARPAAAESPAPEAALAAARLDTTPPVAPPPAVDRSQTVSRPEKRLARSQPPRAPAARPPVQAAQPAAPPIASTAEYFGTLAIDSEPSGARVLINGITVGTTPLLLDQVAVGSRVVRVEADGYQPWSSAVRIVANQRTDVTASLRP